MHSVIMTVAAVAVVQAPQTTVQQDFEAATALNSAGKDAEALAAWEALEKRVARNPRSQAIARLRKALPLIRLDRLDEAAAATRAGLAALPASDATLREDRHSAYLVLGQIDKLALDYSGALASYHQAASLASTPTESLTALLGELRTATFVDPDAAVATGQALNGLMKANQLDPNSRGLVYTALSELYLNLGRFEEARVAAGDAVKALGGLTLRASIADVAARSDYAIAALKMGREDDAREYLAYTGAGRTTAEFGPAVQLQPPECGNDTGLTPDDSAVIEFTVNDQGAVTDSAPVYASRKGTLGLEFARAARGWSWTPDQLKRLPAFFRTRARVELRCSTAFQRPQISDYLRDGLASWLASKSVTLADRERAGDAARLPRERAALAALEREGATSLKLVPALYALAENALTTPEEAVGNARRALTILEAAEAPPVARLAVQVRSAPEWGRGWHASRDYIAALDRMRTTAPYAGNVEARSVLALMIADAAKGSARDRALLNGVADEPALPAAHPLKVGALVRLASLEQSAGAQAAAQAAFAKSGLDAKQCALLDKPPALRFAGGVFPQEAQRWGFEGWTQVQFDIDAKGKVLGPRAVVSYPPFVFTKAGTATVASARFEESYRPDGGLGCGGKVQRIVFRMPG